MKLEVQLAREEFAHYKIPAKEQPQPQGEQIDGLKEQRRMVREQTDKLIGAFMSNDFILLAQETAGVALVVGGTAVRFCCEPNIMEFVMGGKELIEDARTVVDKGLQFAEWDQVKVGLTMLEIAYRGVCACLNVPYEALVRERHRAILAGEPMDPLRYREILVAAGLPMPPMPAANEATSAENLCSMCQGNMPCGTPGHPGNA